MISQETQDRQATIRFALAVAFLYIATFVVARILVPGARFDDGEILQHAQVWAAGYHTRNPPLYEWLTMALFSVGGVHLWLEQALRLTLQAATVGAAYALARKKQLSPAASAAAALLPLTVIYIYMRRIDQNTHTTITGLCYMLMPLAFWAVRERGSWLRHLGLGVVMGCGLLSKHLFALYMLSGALAALAWPETRAALLSRRMLAALLVAGLMALPHYLWLLHLGASAFDAEVEKVASNKGHVAEGRAWAGFKNLLQYALRGTLLPMAVAGVLFLGGALFRGGSRARDPDVSWLSWTVLGTLLLYTAAILIVGIARVRPHHFVFLAPLAVSVLARARAADGLACENRLRWLARFSYGFAVACLIYFGVATWRDVKGCDPCGGYVDYPGLAQRLREAGFSRGAIFYTAGISALNVPVLRESFPDSRTAQWPADPALAAGGDCALLSLADDPRLAALRADSGALPPALAARLSKPDAFQAPMRPRPVPGPTVQFIVAPHCGQ